MSLALGCVRAWDRQVWGGVYFSRDLRVPSTYTLARCRNLLAGPQSASSTGEKLRPAADLAQSNSVVPLCLHRYWDIAPAGYAHMSPLEYKAMVASGNLAPGTHAGYHKSRTYSHPRLVLHAICCMQSVCWPAFDEGTKQYLCFCCAVTDVNPCRMHHICCTLRNSLASCVLHLCCGPVCMAVCN